MKIKRNQFHRKCKYKYIYAETHQLEITIEWREACCVIIIIIIIIRSHRREQRSVVSTQSRCVYDGEPWSTRHECQKVCRRRFVEATSCVGDISGRAGASSYSRDLDNARRAGVWASSLTTWPNSEFRLLVMMSLIHVVSAPFNPNIKCGKVYPTVCDGDTTNFHSKLLVVCAVYMLSHK